MGRRTAAVLVFALLLAGGVAAFRSAGSWLVVGDPLPPHADAVVVLAGSPPGRLLEAADLYRDGVAPRVVLTREQRPPAAVALARRGPVVPSPHEDGRNQLIALGVPAGAIVVLHGRAYSTSSEARLIARWACRTHRRSLIVVTSPSHTRRARLILRRVLAPGTQLAVTPAEADFFPRRRWWRHRRAGKLVLSEYQKLVNYWVRERRQLRPCGR